MCINEFMYLHFHICLHMCKKIGKGSEGFSLKYWQLLPLGTRVGRGQWLRGNFILLYFSAILFELLTMSMYYFYN